MSIPIVDAHIHIFPETHLPTLAWHGPSNPLSSQHSIDEYRHATSPSVPLAPSEKPSSTYLRGFVFLETDRISSVESQTSWTHVLDEVSLLTRIALGTPVPGEGHAEHDAQLCLGIIPWAPVPGGSEVLKRYMALVRERTKTEHVWKKVRGVRYLIQDKPPGTMLQSGFVDGLKWLGREGLAFDLGVDARQGGLGQLREAVEMMKRVYRHASDAEENVVIIISTLKGRISLFWFFLVLC